MFIKARITLRKTCFYFYLENYGDVRMRGVFLGTRKQVLFHNRNICTM